jgi:hypothetical protein
MEAGAENRKAVRGKCVLPEVPDRVPLSSADGERNEAQPDLHVLWPRARTNEFALIVRSQPRQPPTEPLNRGFPRPPHLQLTGQPRQSRGTLLQLRTQ